MLEKIPQPTTRRIILLPSPARKRIADQLRHLPELTFSEENLCREILSCWRSHCEHHLGTNFDDWLTKQYPTLSEAVQICARAKAKELNWIRKTITILEEAEQWETQIIRWPIPWWKNS